MKESKLSIWSLLLNNLVNKKAPSIFLTQILELYSLVIREVSKTLKEPLPDATLLGEAKQLQEHLPEAKTILENPMEAKHSIDNPLQAIQLVSSSLATGIERKFVVHARMLCLLEEFIEDTTIPDAQKEKIVQLTVDSYLVGQLTPVAQFDMLAEKLDAIVLETKYQSREEALRELRRERAKNASIDEVIQKFKSGNMEIANELAKLNHISQKVETTGADVAQIKSGTEQMAGDLAGISEKIDTTGADVVQIKEQTAGIPYFVDQDTKEARANFKKINAWKISMGLDDTEHKILQLHEQQCTQQQIADKLEWHIRTVQRRVAAIEDKFAKRNLPSPFVWNNRKKISEE